MSIIVKLLIVALIGYFVIWPWLRRRWPDFTRRINFALVTSLIVIVLFRLLIWWRRSVSEPEPPPPPFSTSQPPATPPLPETSGTP
jgi:MFS superfamily sulfate permease-like transporter